MNGNAIAAGAGGIIQVIRAVLMVLIYMVPVAGTAQVMVYWESQNERVESLPVLLRDFVLDLYNSGRLPVQSLTVSQQPGPAAAIFHYDFPYLDWSHEISSILCDLNPKQCARPQITAKTVGGSSRTTRGLEISNHSEIDWLIAPQATSHDSRLAEYQINVPDITFFETVNWIPFTVTAGDLQQIYNTQARGCGALGKSGQRFEPGNDFRNYLDNTANLDPTECVLDIFFENISGINYQLLLAAGSVGTRATENLKNDEMEIYELMDQFIETLQFSSEPWSELDLFLTNLVANKSYSVTLPVFSLAAVVNLDDELDFSGSSKAWITKQSDLPFQDQISDILSNSAIFVTPLLDSGPVNWVVDAELDTISALLAGDKSNDSYPLNEDSYSVIRAQLNRVFQHINFPWKGGVEINGGNQRIIVILDEGFADEMRHCVFNLDTQACESSSIVRGSDDFEILPDDDRDRIAFKLYQQNPSSGHGHAVASVAASTWESDAMIGIDPLALPIPFELKWNNVTDHLGRPNFKEKLADLKRGLRNRSLFNQRIFWDAVVWNVSGHIVPLGDKSPIAGLAQHFRLNRKFANNPSSLEYFVFSAGNISTIDFDNANVGEISADCMVYPACFAKEDENFGNVVTVVGAQIGADGHPELWRQNDSVSFANPAFQVAAIARNVPVSLPQGDGAFILASGTSFAAPQVAAAISSLRAANVHDPSVVVGRLIACARMSSKLESYVSGGLLDFDCTLETDRAQLAMEKDHSGRVLPEYAELRPGQLKQVWKADYTPNSDIPVLRGKLASIGGYYSAHPDLAGPSIVGFRTFSDRPDRINIVGWGRKLPDGDPFNKNHAPLLVDNRDRLNSNIILEFQFDGEDTTVCVVLSDVTQFIAAIPSSADDFHDSLEPQCD